MNPVRKATVLISGTGSNLQALIDAVASGRLDLDIVHVISNVANAPGLQRAERAGIRSSILEHGRFADRADFDAALALLMAADEPDLVILAGFMRIIGDAVLEPFAGRMINLHPALLPKFGGEGMYGKRVHEAVLAAAEQESGASIHLVDEIYDHGPVLAQRKVPVLPGDDVHSLADRVFAAECELYPQVVAELARGITKT